MVKGKAFSIPELAIVLVIIAIITSSIIAGSTLTSLSRIVTARSTTSSSVVKDIDGLSLWLETTLEESFLDKNIEDGRIIDIWYDVNPQTTFPKDALQYDQDESPLYFNKKIKGLPALFFDGVDDHLNFDGRFVNRLNYTIIIVEQRNPSENINRFLGDGVSDNFYLGYNGGSLEYCVKPSPPAGCYGVDVNGAPDAKIIAFVQNENSGQHTYVNGYELNESWGSRSDGSLYEGIVFAIGRSKEKFYSGFIGELIIYDRALEDKEIKSIHRYLSKKWLIKIGVF